MLALSFDVYGRAVLLKYTEDISVLFWFSFLLLLECVCVCVCVSAAIGTPKVGGGPLGCSHPKAMLKKKCVL